MDSAERSRRELRRALHENPIDLARAALALAREEYPGLDEVVCLAALDALAVRAMEPMPAGASAQQKVGRLNAFLFHEEGYCGNRSDYADPRNSFLNEVLARRVGIPISLSVLYLEVARRCGLVADGISFPGHFLCKVDIGDAELVVDPFHRGQILSPDELLRRLRQAVPDAGHVDPGLLRAAKPREVLIRMLHNLRQIYMDRGDLPRALSAVDRMLIIVPDNVRLLRERASLFSQLGGTAAAATDLSRVLELEPGAKDAVALRARVRTLQSDRRLLN